VNESTSHGQERYDVVFHVKQMQNAGYQSWSMLWTMLLPKPRPYPDSWTIDSLGSMPPALRDQYRISSTQDDLACSWQLECPRKSDFVLCDHRGWNAFAVG